MLAKIDGDMMKTFAIFLLILNIFLGGKMILAQEIDCPRVGSIPCDHIGDFDIEAVKEKCHEAGVLSFSQRVEECQKELTKKKAETAKELQEIKGHEDQTQRTLETINQGVYQLNLEIANLNITINKLEQEIQEKEKKIKELDERLEDYKTTLSLIIRQIYEYDSFTPLEIFFGHSTISEFTQKIGELEKLENGLKNTIEEIKVAKQTLESQRNQLQEKKDQHIEAKKMLDINRKSLLIRRTEQDYLLKKLAQAKTPLESEIVRIEAKLIELRAAMEKIKSYLIKWTLTGNITWSSIFSAVNSASLVTGVRPALLLAVLQRESTFGQGLGIPGRSQEYCVESWGGNPREYEALKTICARFGYDPDNVPMSRRCAIGPSQFLPTTWFGYEKICPGIYNPWNLNHAVLATGCYLKRNGATSGNEQGALFAYNRATWYANQVLDIASTWQEVIDVCGGLDLNCPKTKEKIESGYLDRIPQE